MVIQQELNPVFDSSGVMVTSVKNQFPKMQVPKPKPMQKAMPSLNSTPAPMADPYAGFPIVKKAESDPYASFPIVKPAETTAMPETVEQTSYGESGLKVAGREFAEHIGPSAAGLGLAIPAGEVGAALGAFGGPAAPVTVPLGAALFGIGGYLAGEYGGAKLQKWIQELTMSPDELKFHKEVLAKGEKEHPFFAGVGQMAAQVPGFFAGGGAGRAVAGKFLPKVVSSATSFGAMGGGAAIEEKTKGTPGSEDLSIPAEVVKGIAVGGTVGLVPGFKSFFGKYLAEPAANALALATSNSLYDRVVNGKPLDVQEIIKQSGQNVAPFMVMSAVAGLLHGRAKPIVEAKQPQFITRQEEAAKQGLSRPAHTEDTATPPSVKLATGEVIAWETGQSHTDLAKTLPPEQQKQIVEEGLTPKTAEPTAPVESGKAIAPEGGKVPATMEMTTPATKEAVPVESIPQIFHPIKESDSFYSEKAPKGWRVFSSDGSRWAHFDEKGNMVLQGQGEKSPTVKEIEQWHNIIQERKDSWLSKLPQKVYIRFGNIPESGRSEHWETGKKEKGISVYTGKIDWSSGVINFDPSAGREGFPEIPAAALLRASEKAPVYLVSGDRIGYGSDNEPILRNIKSLYQLKGTDKGFVPIEESISPESAAPAEQILPPPAQEKLQAPPPSGAETPPLAPAGETATPETTSEAGAVTSDIQNATEKIADNLEKLPPTDQRAVNKELSDNLMEARDNAKSEEDVLDKEDYLKIQKLRKEKKSERNVYGRDNERIGNAIEKILSKHFEKVTIDIPDDGKFSVWNTKENLDALLKRASRLPGGKVKATTAEPSAPSREGRIKELMDKTGGSRGWAEKVVAKEEAKEKPFPVGPGAATANSDEFRMPGDEATQTLNADIEIAIQQREAARKAGRVETTVPISSKEGISIADKVAQGKGVMARTVLQAKAAWEPFKRILFGAPTEPTDYNKAKRDWFENSQATVGMARQHFEEWKRLVPEPLMREGLNKYAEASFTDNPEQTLRDWAARSKGDNRRPYERALNLTPEEKRIAKSAIEWYNEKGKEAVNAGALRDMIENYAGQHMVDFSGEEPEAILKLKSDIASGRLNTNFRYAMRRMFETEFDLEQAGYKLKSKDLFEKMANYEQSLGIALANRAQVKALQTGVAEGTQTPENPKGLPILATGLGRHVADGLNGNEALFISPHLKPRVLKTEVIGEGADTGEIISYDKGEYVSIGNIPALKKWRWAETLPDGKQIFVEGDLWIHKNHAQDFKNTFGTSRLYDIPGVGLITKLGSLAKGLKLSLTAFHQAHVGSHALFHLTRPFGMPEIDFLDRFTRRAMNAGVSLVDPTPSEIFSEGASSGRILNDIPGVGKYLRAYTDYTFKSYIPRLKMATFRNVLRRNLQRYEGKMTEDQIWQQSASEVNAAFGELPWKLLGINPTFMHGLRMTFMAPDFLSARAGFAAQAIGGSREQRMAIGVMVASLWTASRILNYLFSEDHALHFERPFSLVVGEREYSFRSIASDLQHAIRDPRSFIYSRLSPQFSSAIELLTKRNWTGQKESFAQALGEVAKRFVPIPATPREDVPFSSRVATLAGATVRRYSPTSELHKLVAEWREKNDPQYDPNLDFPISKYRPLRYALEDGDINKAANVIRDLKSKGESLEKIREGFMLSLSKRLTQNEVMDIKFKRSLDEKGKQLLAESQRMTQKVRQDFMIALRDARINPEKTSMIENVRGAFEKYKRKPKQ